MCDRVKLAVIARKEAEKPYNGNLGSKCFTDECAWRVISDVTQTGL